MPFTQLQATARSLGIPTDLKVSEMQGRINTATSGVVTVPFWSQPLISLESRRVVVARQAVSGATMPRRQSQRSRNVRVSHVGSELTFAPVAIAEVIAQEAASDEAWCTKQVSPVAHLVT